MNPPPLPPSPAPPRPRPTDLADALEVFSEKLLVLLDQSLTLARLEARRTLRDGVVDAARQGALFGGAGVAAAVGYAMGCLAGLRALERMMAPDAAAAVLAAVHGLGAWWLLRRAMNRRSAKGEGQE